VGHVLVYEKLIFLDNLYINYQEKMNIKYSITLLLNYLFIIIYYEKTSR